MENGLVHKPEVVRDLMTVGVLTCAPDTSFDDLARFFVEKNVEAVIVLDTEEGHALGMISQDELVGAYTKPERRSLKAEDIMRDEIPQVPPDIPLTAAAQIMHDQKTRTLFIMHHAGGVVYPAAMISYQHLLRHLAAQDAADLKDLGIHAERQSPLEAFIERREAARKRNRPLNI